MQYLVVCSYALHILTKNDIGLLNIKILKKTKNKEKHKNIKEKKVLKINEPGTFVLEL